MKSMRFCLPHDYLLATGKPKEVKREGTCDVCSEGLLKWGAEGEDKDLCRGRRQVPEGESLAGKLLHAFVSCNTCVSRVPVDVKRPFNVVEEAQCGGEGESLSQMVAR